MKQPIKKKNFKPGSLNRDQSARTFLLRMAADESRAERIRELYEEAKAIDPRRVTWRRLGDHVGVSERAAHAWSTTGGIDFEHVPKIAEFFVEYRPGIDADYIWRGPQPEETPDLLEVTARAEQLDEVSKSFEQRVDEIEDRQKELVRKVDEVLKLVKRLVAAGVPAPPVVRDRRATGGTPTPPTGQPERRQAAGGSRRDTA